MRITQRLDARSSHRRNEETPDNSLVFSRERTSSRRKRFIQECARSTIHRRALPTSLPLDRLSLFPAWTNVGAFCRIRSGWHAPPHSHTITPDTSPADALRLAPDGQR